MKQDVTAASSPLTRGLTPFRLGLWLFSYGLFFVLMLASGSAGPRVALWMAAGAAIGVVLSGAIQGVVLATSAMRSQRRLALIAGIVLGATCIHALLDALTLGRSLVGPDQRTLRYVLLYALQSFTFLLWIHAFFAACIWLFDATLAIVEKQKQLAAAEAEAQKATLRALRAQVHPHFLFNALNAAASLVASGRNADAEELIDRLSEFFRASLVGDREAMIPLGEEFDTLDSYLQIEALRFPDRLRVSMHCPADLTEARIPSFLLQPLVENAIKHGVAPSANPVQVSVEASTERGRLRLSVENSGAAPTPGVQHDGAGVGLRNVEDRLKVTYGSNASVRAEPTQDGFRVDLDLPLSAAEPAL
ncbi:MAG: sensor histidine kinase [Hyphomonadaceae bacterium]